MSNSRSPNNLQAADIKFAIISALAIVAAAAALVSLWPLTLSAARNESAALVVEGQKTSGGEAETDFQLATWLDRTNHDAFAGLARTQIAAGHPDDALANLAKAGEGSEVEQLKIRTLLELGRYSDAANAAASLTTAGRPDDDLLLAGLTYDLSHRSADASVLLPRVSSPEAARRLQRAQSSNIALADELYATGLPKSSSAILTKLPAAYDRNLLLAHIYASEHSDPNVAIGYLTAANSINPANTEARLLLAKLYRSQNQLSEATEQEVLAAKFQAGRP